ncbi:hypothetical protein DPMN_176913 [Dreissena polymorpha]|uniref:Uncharacterized protein n=1 Tax=Dreissena polymorpha TaxID=45954 RepID=A0A9D4EAA6_DREPO|nr:hypothetical protein DPMN_176913 [Dreissena polymorpha]
MEIEDTILKRPNVLKNGKVYLQKLCLLMYKCRHPISDNVLIVVSPQMNCTGVVIAVHGRLRASHACG